MRKIVSLILVIIILAFPLASCNKYALSLKDMLIFTEVEDGFAVAGISLKDRAISIEMLDIPSEYKGKPVVEISPYGFAGYALLVNVTIPDSVKRIGESAFIGCRAVQNFNVSENNKHFKSIDGHLFTTDNELIQYALGQAETLYILPDGIKTISTNALAGSLFLVQLSFPDTLERIEKLAFAQSPFLKSVTFPDSVTYLGDEAFSRCWGLESVTFGNGITEIPLLTFMECTKLKNVNLGGVKIIGETAFMSCISLEHIDIPDGAIRIEDGAFGICSALESITLPETLEYIGPRVFTTCAKLKSIDIPNNITTLGYGTFNLCTSLSEITLPANLSKIESLCFSGCLSLKRINFEGTMEQWNAIEKESSWNLGTGQYTVYCTDGNIEK